MGRKLQLVILVTLATVIFVAFRTGISRAQTADDLTSRNVSYAQRDGASPNLTKLDIYRFEGAKKAPVMIMIHGGGWANGDKANRGLNENKVPFFQANGFVYVTINYRLSPDVVHPAHVEDVAEAVAWVHQNIEKYGGDRNRIFVMGHSAGAHLAALVATDDRRLKKHGKDLSAIKGVILLDGAGYNIPKQMNTLSFFGGVLASMYETAFTTNEETQRDASPFFHVGKGKRIPPFLIFTAGGRIGSVNQSKELVTALRDAGVQAETIDDPDANHGSINRNFGSDGMATRKAKEFLDGILKK